VEEDQNKKSKIGGNLRDESKRSKKWRGGAKRLRLHITTASLPQYCEFCIPEPKMLSSLMRGGG
jgi:hypothetical protein